MTTRIRTRGVTLNASLENFLEHKLHYALDRFAFSPQEVDIVVEDRGGHDTRCRLAIRLTKRLQVLIDETGDSLRGVLSRAVDRADAQLGRLHERYYCHQTRLNLAPVTGEIN